MSHRKTKPKNKPPLSNPFNTSPTSPSSLHLTSFHPHKPLYAVATTAVGQNVLRIFDARPGVAEPRCEVRLKKGEEIICLAWTGGDKKRKRRQSIGEDGLVCGLKSGRIYVIEPASGDIVRKVEGHAASVNGWFTDEERAWSCGGDGKVKCWDSRIGNCVATVSPDIETELTSLALSQETIFLSSLQTLYLLSNPSGNILSSITPHTAPIHIVRSSQESAIVATAAVGDRFIAVISSEGNKLTQLGSLICTHDVRTFLIKDDVILAITVVGTLEVFQSFSTSFDRSKKGGMTRSPDVEIHLTISRSSSANLKIQDAVFRGKETVISWIEGAKYGFHNIDIYSMSGKVEINVETRKEHSQQQASQPYQESQALVFTGTDPPTAHVNGTKSLSADLSFADRLSQLHPQSALVTTAAATIIPSSSSLSTVLTQALNSSDEKLLQTCFQQTHTDETIHNTLLRLSPPLVPSLLSYFNSVLSRKQKRTAGILDWIREVIIIHAGYLVSQGDEIKEVLERLKGTLQRRGQTWERLVRLKGRLELLRAVKGRGGSNVRKEPEVRWVEEGDEEFEEEVEDVRYLTRGDEMESVVDGDINDIDDVGMENVVASEEEDDDEEKDEEEEETDDEDESSDDLVKPARKVNGIPHFSDSEDSAVELEDLIDDEVSEASEDESEEHDDEEDEEGEDEEDEEDADEEEEEEEEEIIRPKKKSKSQR